MNVREATDRPTEDPLERLGSRDSGLDRYRRRMARGRMRWELFGAQAGLLLAAISLLEYGITERETILGGFALAGALALGIGVWRLYVLFKSHSPSARPLAIGSYLCWAVLTAAQFLAGDTGWSTALEIALALAVAAWLYSAEGARLFEAAQDPPSEA